MYLSMYMTLSSYLVETCNCSYLWNYVPYMGCASAWHPSTDESNTLGI